MTEKVAMNPRFTLRMPNELKSRFYEAKHRSRKRLERKELKNEEFLMLILDVWEEYEEPRLCEK